MGGSLVFPRPKGPGSFSSLPGLSSPRPERRRRPGDCRRQTGRLSPRERPVLCVDMRNSGWISLLSCFPIRGNRLFCALCPLSRECAGRRLRLSFLMKFSALAQNLLVSHGFGFWVQEQNPLAEGGFLSRGFPSCSFLSSPWSALPFCPAPCRGFGKGREGKAQERRSGRRGENPLLRGSRGRRASFPSPAGGRGKAGRRRRTGRKGGGEGRPSRKGGLPGFFAFPYAPVVSTSLPFRLAARREGSVLSVFSLRHQVVRNG